MGTCLLCICVKRAWRRRWRFSVLRDMAAVCGRMKKTLYFQRQSIALCSEMKAVSVSQRPVLWSIKYMRLGTCSPAATHASAPEIRRVVIHSYHESALREVEVPIALIVDGRIFRVHCVVEAVVSPVDSTVKHPAPWTTVSALHYTQILLDMLVTYKFRLASRCSPRSRSHRSQRQTLPGRHGCSV